MSNIKRSRIVLSLLFASLFCFTVSVDSLALAQSTADQAAQPDPISIGSDRKKMNTQDIPRDEVICFALYTVQDRVLKLSAQLYPLRKGESREVHLEISRDGDWKRIASERVDELGWLATFRVEDWDHSQDWQYRVVHGGGAQYSGRIRRDPRDKEEIVVAAFTGNSNKDRGPRADIVRNVQQGITVYYTSLNVGGIDFAIVEDRKWKTGPAGMVPQQGPRPDHINDPEYDPQTVDLPEARLLGERQLRFLSDWGHDWQDATMKAVLSQTIFAGGAHIHGNYEGRLQADLDSNGWPQSGRARALHAMRRSFAFHIAGDQHLATVIQHGTNQWEDAGYSFCVPSIVNYYGRWWWPLEKPEQRSPNNPLPFTGRFYDGFLNKVTMHAYANPTKDNFNAAGYGIVRFNKDNRKITMECWPRHIDVAKANAKQFPGWPITIDQDDNYGRQPMAYLPKLEIDGQSNPVVRVIDEASQELVYSWRIRGNSWRPKVFREGTYTVEIVSDGKTKKFNGIASVPSNDASTLEINF